MTFALSSLPYRAARSAVVATFLVGTAWPLAVMAQEEPAPADETMQPETTAPAEATPADPAPTEPAAEATTATDPAATDPSAAPTDPALATIPVEPAEPAAETAPSYPYTFAAARLRHTEFDDIASDGLGIEGSYLLLPNIFGIAAITVLESDDETGTKSTLYEIGAGYRQPFFYGTDLNASLRVQQDDINSEPESEVKMGLRADFGVRKQLMPQLEGALAVVYLERSRNARGLLHGSALYEFMPRFSVGAEVTASSNSTAYGLLGRWSF